jgi:UDP-3-O-[3-hydroxymyristoyl] glucosamine N-acyltransferase
VFIGQNVHIGRDSVVGNDVRLGSHSRIGANVRIAGGMRIDADAQVPDSSVLGTPRESAMPVKRSAGQVSSYVSDRAA